MAARSAVQAMRELEEFESAANDPRLYIPVDPVVAYGVNQQFVFGTLCSKAWLDHAFQQIGQAGVANDFGALEAEANAAGLKLTEEEFAATEKLRVALEANGARAAIGMEQVALEDGLGIPAIAILVLVVIIIIALWVRVF